MKKSRWLSLSLLALAVPVCAGPFFTDGFPDASFGQQGLSVVGIETVTNAAEIAFDIVVQRNGRLVGVGSTTVDQNQMISRFMVFRLRKTGELDTSYGNGGALIVPFGTDNGAAFSAAIQPDGKTVVVGVVGTMGGNTDMAIARLTKSGQLDPSFSGDGMLILPFDSVNNGVDVAYDVAIQADGKIVVAGSVQVADQSIDPGLARLNPDGSLDPSFGTGGKLVRGIPLSVPAADWAQGVSIQPDNKIVFFGPVQASSAGDLIPAVTRLLPSGALDLSFGFGDGIDGFAALMALTLGHHGLTVLPDGNIVVSFVSRVPADAPRSTDVGIGMLNAAGEAIWNSDQDVLFGGSDTATDQVFTKDGNILVAGFTGTNVLARHPAMRHHQQSGIPQDRQFTFTESFIMNFTQDGVIDSEAANTGIQRFAQFPQYDALLLFGAAEAGDVYLAGAVSVDNETDADFAILKISFDGIFQSSFSEFVF